MSKISNVKLIAILLVLGAVIGVVLFRDSKKGERNFRSELVSFDSTKVTSISIFPKSKPGEEVKIFKDGGKWKVQATSQKSVVVEDEQIAQLFSQLVALKPTRLAGKSQDKWSEFQVDSSATRVIVNEGDKKVLDLIVGKFSFQQGGGGGMQMQMQGRGQSFETFVRLKDETETYTVQGFLDPMLNRDVAGWRNKTIVKGNKEEWTSLPFTLPAFGSYVLEKQDSVWLIAGQAANNEEVENYLNTLSSLSGNSFNDDFPESALGAADFVLEISTTLGDKIKVEGFAKDNNVELLRSTQNPESLFNAADGRLFEKVFVGSPKFFPADTLGGEI